MLPAGGVVVGETNTVAVAVVVPPGFTAVSVYIVVTVGETVVAVPLSEENPLIAVVLAPETFHASVELCPAVIETGEAVNDVMTGFGHAMVALQVEVAMVEDASVACNDID